MWKEYINKIPNYDDSNLPKLLNKGFLKCFYVNNQFIKHMVLKKNESIIYANIFSLRLKKGLQYNKSNFFVKFILRLLNLKIFYLGNWYLNNFHFFYLDKSHDIKNLLKDIKEDYSAIVLPDYLMRDFENKTNLDFIKVEIEEDMFFDVNNNWTSINDYIECLKKKYKRRIEKVNLTSKDLIIKSLSNSDLKLYEDHMQLLFNQVVNNEKFSGPQFDVKTLLELSKNNFLSIYGYFDNNTLVAFSTYIENDKNLISYYVGFDKTLNEKYSLYSRILLESIKLGIEKNKSKIIFGRTANEFKSNFGATPVKSYIYIRFQNSIVHSIFKRIFKNNSIKKWVQRSPYNEVPELKSS